MTHQKEEEFLFSQKRLNIKTIIFNHFSLDYKNMQATQTKETISTTFYHKLSIHIKRANSTKKHNNVRNKIAS